MLLRSAVAISVLGLSLAACPGALSEGELIDFENSARGGDRDAATLDATTSGPDCPDIPVLLRTTCADVGCHGITAPAGGLNLASTNYAGRLNSKVSASDSCSGEKLLDLANPEKSLLYTQLDPRPACGSTMPLGKPALDDQQRRCVLAWIKAGAMDKGASGGTDDTDAGTAGEPSPMPGNPDAGTATPPGDVAPGTELSRAGWLATASRTGTQVDVSAAQAALDNDLNTRWGTGIPQDGMTDWFQVDMTAARKFSTIELRMGMWDEDQPRSYRVYASNDPSNWGTAIAAGTTPDQKQPTVTITLPVQTARYIRMENVGIDSNNWWSIYELVVKR